MKIIVDCDQTWLDDLEEEICVDKLIKFEIKHIIEEELKKKIREELGQEIKNLMNSQIQDKMSNEVEDEICNFLTSDKNEIKRCIQSSFLIQLIIGQIYYLNKK